MYECKELHIASVLNQPGTEEGEQYWRKVSFSEKDYYSLFTLVFNEDDNRFGETLTIYPKIYSRLFNRYFSPDPTTGNQGNNYVHRKGEPLVYYGLEHEGFSEYIVNYAKSIVKAFIAAAIVAIRRPPKVTVRTQFISEQGVDDRYTEMLRDERKQIVMRENNVFVQFRKNMNAQGQTNKLTAPMRGLYAKIRIYFKAREKQKVNDIFVGVRTGQRNNQNP